MSPLSQAFALFERAILPRSVVSHDLRTIYQGEALFSLVYDRDYDMIFMQEEDYLDCRVWISAREVAAAARFKVLQGEWCSRHESELDDLLFALKESQRLHKSLIIYDGVENGWLPFTQFLYIHSQKYVKRNGIFVIVEREGTANDHGVAVLTGRDGEVQIEDMFNVGTMFHPVDAEDHSMQMDDPEWTGSVISTEFDDDDDILVFVNDLDRFWADGEENLNEESKVEEIEHNLDTFFDNF